MAQTAINCEGLRLYKFIIFSQANQQKETLQAALALRQQYYTSKAELETCLKDCNDQLEAVNVIGVAVPTKLDRYKVGNSGLIK